MEPAQILQSVQQAALAAAQAAQAMREANEKRVTGFGEASKMVQCPKEFGTSSSVEDQAQWSDFAFSFKQWLFLADWAFETDIKYVEENPNTPVAFQDNAVGQASKERSRKMYSVYELSLVIVCYFLAKTLGKFSWPQKLFRAAVSDTCRANLKVSLSLPLRVFQVAFEFVLNKGSANRLN